MRLILTICIAIISLSAVSQTARDYVRSGNKEYVSDSLANAIMNYDEAIKLDPTLNEAKFNLGDAYYRNGKYEDAINAFQDLAQTTDNKEVKSNAFYNQGNAYMQTQKFQDAMNSYKNSMKANPQNSQARYNYAYAKKMLEEQQKQEQNKDDQQDKDNQDENNDNKDDKQDKKDDQNKDNKDQDKDKGDQDQKDENKDSDDQKNKDENKDQDQNKDKPEDEKKDQNNQDGQNDENKDQPQDQQDQKEQQPQPNQLSKADAERLLKAMEDKEKETRDKVNLKKSRVKNSKKSEKDW